MASLEIQPYLAPADQPTSVHEIAERLFPAYCVEGGSVHLAGCRLEDRLFVKVGDADQARAGVVYTDESGRAIEEEFAQSLGMNETVAWTRPPEMPPDLLAGMVRRSAEAVRQRWGVEGDLDASFIWCKHAEGKLRFTIGEQSADLPFSGWTRTLERPPFRCPYSGVASFHIASTDDGRIAAAEGIGTCAETGRRVLADELVTCEATGRAVLAELTRRCPVTGQVVLKRAMVRCSMCQQRVSSSCVVDGRCLACRSPRPIARTTPWLAKLLGEHEGLDRWPKWSGAETSEVRVLVAGGWWRRLLLVVGKEDATIRYAALGHRFSNEFLPIDVGRVAVISR